MVFQCLVRTQYIPKMAVKIVFNQHFILGLLNCGTWHFCLEEPLYYSEYAFLDQCVLLFDLYICRGLSVRLGRQNACAIGSKLPLFPYNRDGHQLISIQYGFRYPSKEFLVRVGWVYPQQREFRPCHMFRVSHILIFTPTWGNDPIWFQFDEMFQMGRKDQPVFNGEMYSWWTKSCTTKDDELSHYFVGV